jgi:hypothetical protein
MNCADLLLAAHDAGGAQILCSWSKAHPENRYRYCLQGPAVEVFFRSLGDLENITVEDLPARLDQQRPDLILTTTGWATGMETQVLALGGERGIRTAAYLDHWANYRERFGYPGPWLDHLPDEIWCPDTESRKLCESLGFPAERLVTAGNPYLDGLAAETADAGFAEEPGTVLYICEPISEHMRIAHGNPRHKGYDEYDAMRHCFEAVGRWIPPVRKILVRLHPSEAKGKYDGFLKGFTASIGFRISDGTSLLQDIARSSAVVGCESMAMVVALRAGKKVFTSIPPGGEPCVLPFAEIKPL